MKIATHLRMHDDCHAQSEATNRESSNHATAWKNEPPVAILERGSTSFIALPSGDQQLELD